MRAWLLAALLRHAAAEPVRVVGILKDAAAPDAAQHLYAFLRSASYGSVHVGSRARAEIDAVIKLDAPAPRSSRGWRRSSPGARSRRTRRRPGAASWPACGASWRPVRGVVFQGSLLDAFERGRSGPPCETVEGPACRSTPTVRPNTFLPDIHVMRLCQDAFGDVIQGNTLVPVVFDAKTTHRKWLYESIQNLRYQLRKNDNRARNTSPKTKKKWTALGPRKRKVVVARDHGQTDGFETTKALPVEKEVRGHARRHLLGLQL